MIKIRQKISGGVYSVRFSGEKFKCLKKKDDELDPDDNFRR